MAISSPLLEASIDGAHGVLLSIQGGSDLGLFEINEAAQLVSNSAAVDANIIFGAVIDDALGDEVRVTVIAAGFDEQRPGRPAASAAVPLLGSSRASTAGGGSAPGQGLASATGAGSTASTGNGNGNGHAPSSGAQHASTSAAWAGHGSATDAAAASGASGQAAAAPAPGRAGGPQDQAAGGKGAPAPAKPPSWTTSPPASSGYGASAQPASGTSAAGTTAGPAGSGTGQAAETPAAGSDRASGYVPAPVSFVSPDEDEDYGAKSGYGRDERDSAGGGPAWKDSGRAGKQDKVFDVNAGRRRPVVFEEEDDLDVPDFLK
jgi:cell division protein FtsZ